MTIIGDDGKLELSEHTLTGDITLVARPRDGVPMYFRLDPLDRRALRSAL